MANSIDEHLKNRRAYFSNERKKKKEENKKIENIHFRLTANEYKFLKKQAKLQGTSLTEYLLEASLYCKVVSIQISELDELTTAIVKLGVNVNQIAKALNVIKLKDTVQAADIEKIHSDFILLKNLFESLETLSSAQWIKLHDAITQNTSYEFCTSFEDQG